MPSLNSDLLDVNTRTALSRAAEVMRSYAKPALMPECLLLAMMRLPECTAARALARLADSRGFKLKDMEAELETQIRTRVVRGANFTFTTEQNTPVELTDEMLIVLDEARAIALAAGEIYIGTEHALGAMAQTGVSTAGLLGKRGITPAAIAGLVDQGVVSRRSTLQDWIKLAQHGQLPPLVMRDGLLREVQSILSLARDRHVLLVGQPGTGRRALAQTLALLAAEGKLASVKAMVEISDVAWLDNPVASIQVGLRQAQGGVLFIANIHRFFGRDPRLDAVSRELQKVLANGDSGVTIIGTTTDGELVDKIKPNALVMQHVHTVNVPAASVDETIKMLGAQQAMFVREYDVQVEPGALKSAAQLAGRYIGANPLPGCAMQVLHRACAIARANKPAGGAENRVDAEDVTLAISIMTGIPASKLGADERSKFAQMTETLQQRVIGQSDAIVALSRAVKAARVGLKDPKRPIGSFLFLGPSGVGKTETARALAEFLFGTEDQMIALDMSEYQKDDTINRLIGSPPGYVGYEAGGQLTEKVLKTPYAVVVFDEVEKAHPRILDILLQVMEEGRLTDGQGRVANFRETVVLLTSNLGARYLNDPALAPDASRELAMEDVRSFFRPEFLNRLDDIIMFRPLGPESLRSIMDLMIKKEAKMSAERGMLLEITLAAREWLLAQNDHPEWGARPLRRILQKNVRERLVDFLLTRDVPPAKVVVDVKGDALDFIAASA